MKYLVTLIALAVSMLLVSEASAVGGVNPRIARRAASREAGRASVVVGHAGVASFGGCNLGVASFGGCNRAAVLVQQPAVLVQQPAVLVQRQHVFVPQRVRVRAVPACAGGVGISQQVILGY